MLDIKFQVDALTIAFSLTSLVLALVIGSLEIKVMKELKGQDKNNQPKGIPHHIEWEVKDRGPPWNPATDTCRLCTLEKYHIMFNPAGATLNQRDEFFSHCYHKTPQLLIHK